LRNFFLGVLAISLIGGISEIFNLSIIWSIVVLFVLSVIAFAIQAYVIERSRTVSSSKEEDHATEERPDILKGIKEAPEDKSFDIE
jgi:membrane protein implicated in regulation of membrane protease activity